MIQTQRVLTDSETKRLEALSSYNVLDTLPEKEYDAITRLASYICQVPVALISLIDEERQWFKSKYGVEVDQTSRADAFCAHTILSDELMEVTNAAEHEIFKDNPFVAGEMNVRFYAGAPLIDPDGHHLGSLCVIDTVPRKLTPEQRDALRTLADEVMSHFLLRKQKQELQKSLAAHKEFFNLFDASPDLHLIANEDSSIELINKAVTNILGYQPEQCIGKSLWSFVAGAGRDEFVGLIEKAKATGKAFDLETRTYNKDGSEKWIGWCGVYKGGKWYSSGRDITYQKKLTAELEQLSLVASKIINGVMIADANDNIIWTNDAFEKVTGFSFEDVKGKRLRDIIIGKSDQHNPMQQYHDHIASKKSYSVDAYATRKDGQEVWLSLITTVIYNEQGEVDKYIRVISDITWRKNAERDLEILSFAALKSPSGMMSRSADGTVIWMNEAMEKITGYTLEEMKGKRFGSTLVGKDTDMAVFESALKAMQEQRPFNCEMLIYPKNSEPIWIAMSNSPLLNDAGDVERQVTTIMDINDSKNAEAELKMLSLVASNTTSGVVINNADGEIEWVNSAFEKITGFDINDVRNQHLGDVLQGELTDVAIIQKGRELSKNKQSFEVDLLAYHKDGTPMWLTVINSVILNKKGEVEKYIEVIIDISSKKKIELELIAAKEEALALSRAKDMFISVMSHEIRTPLNAVIGMSHLLLNGPKLDTQNENLEVLKFSSDNLLTLINDVLDFTKIETGNVELEQTEVHLRDMIQSITASLQYKTKEKNIYLQSQIDAAVPDIVIGDGTRLSQIILNIASNAVKFTREGGVKINLEVIDQTEEQVRIRFSVADTGIGIPSDKLNTIFESFKQADASTTRNFGGTGLGLAISKRLVELHDSRINVDSAPGKGSTFWFTITFNKADNKKSSSINVESGLNINVLVVDDNQINRLLINKILTKWGAQVDFAENGLQAVNKIESNKYDAVLMDIHMPEMGGLEATQIIRNKPEPYFKNLPIIALTASMLTSQMGDIGNAGMNDYILKPFEPKILFEKLSKYQK